MQRLIHPLTQRDTDRKSSTFSILLETTRKETFDVDRINTNNKPAIALEKLADPAVWQRAKTLAGQRYPESPDTVTLEQYNWTAAAGGILENLELTNPGAVAWLMTFCPYDPDEEINHPGQVIATVKQHMKQNGLPDNCWRTAATLPKDYIIAIAMLGTPTTATKAIAAIAAAGTKPGLRTAYTMGYALATRGREHANTPLGLRNQQHAAMLACKADNGQNIVETGNLSHAVDYAIAMSAQGKEVRSTTFAGLMKATRRWHRQFQAPNIHQVWNNLLTKNKGRYRAWNSLRGTVEAHGVTATPLTTDQQLRQESADMEHCVLTHGWKCAAGNSRIFSLSRKGRKTATGEIFLGRKGWVSTEVAGYRKTPGPDTARS